MTEETRHLYGSKKSEELKTYTVRETNFAGQQVLPGLSVWNPFTGVAKGVGPHDNTFGGPSASVVQESMAPPVPRAKDSSDDF